MVQISGVRKNGCFDGEMSLFWKWRKLILIWYLPIQLNFGTPCWKSQKETEMDAKSSDFGGPGPSKTPPVTARTGRLTKYAIFQILCRQIYDFGLPKM